MRSNKFQEYADNLLTMKLLEELVGHHLIVGFQETNATSDLIDHLKKIHAGGIILFRRNFVSARQFKRLISDIQIGVGRPLLVCIDHEGGRVIHLAQEITVFPDNLLVGQLNDADVVRKQGEIEGRELSRLGIHLNLAPTLDVLTETFSPNIGIRSYGYEAKTVAKLGVARIQGMQSQGVGACAKHFPGLGQAPVDPHLDLPVLPSSWADMKTKHLVPFRASIQKGVSCVMSSHPVYPKLDSAKIPTTFSKKIITGQLREALGFEGLILSDDLEMGALRHFGNMGQIAVRTVAAGHDMILICHDRQFQKEAFSALVSAYEAKRLETCHLVKASQRLQNFLSRYARSEKNNSKFKTSNSFSAKVAYTAIRKTFKKSFWKSFPIHEAMVVFPKISELSKKFYIEEEWLDETKALRNIFKTNRRQLRKIEIVPLDPSPKDIKRIIELAARHKSVLLFCYDAHLSANLRNMLERLKCSTVNLGLVFLRDPYDLEFIQKTKIPYINLFGFRNGQIQAGISAIFDAVS